MTLKKFLYKNESYVVKEGVRTTSIRPAGKKDVLVTVSGLHPNTRDQAVVRYLEAHGKVNRKEKIIHHVFPGEHGSTLCAGKFNGNRSYVMEITIPMGSFHIIDGEKVTIRYPGQEWSCARCHQFRRCCPGLAIARDCTADRVLLSNHMDSHWQKIGFRPETESAAEVDEDPDLDIQVGQIKRDLPIVPESQFSKKYKSVIVKGFLPTTDLSMIMKELKESGLSSSYTTESLLRNDKTGAITIPNLQPEQCLTVMENMHSKKFLGRKVFITSVVSNSPTKTEAAPSSGPATPVPDLPVLQGKSAIINSSSPKSLPLSSSPILDPRAGSKASNSTNMEEFEFEPPFETLNSNCNEKEVNLAGFELPNKRKASLSPEVKELSRKDKKAAKKEMKSKSKSELKAQRQLDMSSSKNQ